MEIRRPTMARDNQKRRNNHYIPKMLLKNFTNEDGNLYFYDKRMRRRRILPTVPEKLYMERDLYTLCDEGGNIDDSAERLFAELERKTAPVLKKIITATRTRKEPGLTPSERRMLDHYSYCQWARVPETAYYVLDRSSERNAFRELVCGLSDEELKKFKKEVLVGGFVSVITNPSERILSFLGGKSLAFVVISKKNKSFVIGSISVLQVFPGNGPSGLGPRPFTALWLPVAHDVAVAYGEGEGGLMEFTNDRELRQFNEDVFKQSQAIAGRSDKLIRSLANCR